MNRYVQQIQSLAEEVIPGATQTYSKGHQYFPKNYPKFIIEGNGCTVMDHEGRRYTDFICGLGAITLGYRYPAVDEAIVEQLTKGISFSLPNTLEYKAAELLIDLFPYHQMVRFLKTGSGATTAAVKVARAYTKRDIIIKCVPGYHGWHDWYSCHTDKDLGIPAGVKDLTLEFKYNDIASLEKILKEKVNEVACVIMEPMVNIYPHFGFLNKVRDLCHEHGTLLIFDETLTGFRWHVSGAQHYFGVAPDITVLGKGMANGMPLSAVLGSSTVMDQIDGGCFVSTTFGGETLSLAAAIATINTMKILSTQRYCFHLGKILQQELGTPHHIYGHPSRPILRLERDDDNICSTYLTMKLAEAGYLVHPGLLINICYSHQQSDILGLAKAIRTITNKMNITELGNMMDAIDGKPWKAAFKRY